MTLSQQDLNVRLQKTGCCVGQEAKRLAQYYLYGSECAEEQLQKVTILNAYLDILSCYKVQATTATNWEYVFDLYAIKVLPIGSVIDVFIGGELITSYTTQTVEICTELNSLAAVIQANSNVISVTTVCNIEINKAEITVTVPCNMSPAYVKSYYSTADTDVTTYYNVYTKQEGKCITQDEDNCITEEQINKIVENISVMCKDCFKPAGFAYYNK